MNSDVFEHLLNMDLNQIYRLTSSQENSGFPGNNAFFNVSAHPPRFWLPSGDQLNYQNYMGNRLPTEETTPFGSLHVPMELPEPTPTLPQFRNEFADYRIGSEPTMNHVPMLRPPLKPQKLNSELPLKHCKFCKKNGESADRYMSHQLFDQNEIVCPVLRTFICTNCGNKGHTR